MAGVKRDHMHRVVKRQRVTALQLGAQGIDLRCQPRLRLPFGPHQLVGKVGESG